MSLSPATQTRIHNLLNAAALTICIGFVLYFAVVQPEWYEVPDYNFYINAARGDLEFWFYPYWLTWLFEPFTWVPFYTGWVIWSLFNIAGVVYATRVFEQRLWVVLLSYQMLWLLTFGQIAGVVAGGVAWYWQQVDKRPLLAGCAAPLVLAKPQVGIPLLVTIGLLRGSNWQARIVSTLPSVALLLLSLLVEPLWIQDTIDRIAEGRVHENGVISLWHSIHPAVIVLWLPTLIACPRLRPLQQLVLVMATIALTVPSFRQSESVILYAMPVSFLPLLGNIVFFTVPPIWQLAAIVPGAVYLRGMWLAAYRGSATDTAPTSQDENPPQYEDQHSAANRV